MGFLLFFLFNCSFLLLGFAFEGASDQTVEHPWQLEGPKGTYQAKKVEEGLFVRVDMAGISKSEVQLNLEGR